MINLLNANFFKVRKDIFTYICLGLCLLMALGNGIMGMVFKWIVEMPEEAAALMEGLYSGKQLFASALSPVNNMGIFIPIFLYIIMNRDYTTGAIRHKIISGYRREKVYLSSYLVTLVCGLLFCLFNVLSNLALGTLFLGYGAEWNAGEFVLICKVILLGMLVFAVFLTILHFIIHVLKTAGYVAYIAVLFALLGLSSLSMLETDSRFVRFLVDVNPINQMTAITGFRFDGHTVVTTIVCSVVLITVFFAGGLYLFKKTDLK